MRWIVFILLFLGALFNLMSNTARECVAGSSVVFLKSDENYETVRDTTGFSRVVVQLRPNKG
jgi:hypothetical protein